MSWQPNHITSFVESRQSSTQVAIVDTDEGRGYLKAIGNPEGEHALACDWVGTQLAAWFGLRTFEQAFVDVDEFVEIPFLKGGVAEEGPALVSRAIQGLSWSGSAKRLKLVANPEDISRLVVFDTWILNRDRFFEGRRNLDNVFLASEAQDVVVMAIDHTHCFGTRGGELTARIAQIDNCRDERIYGLFTEFRPLLAKETVSQCVEKLDTIDTSIVQPIVNAIPRDWNVSLPARRALVDMIVQRSAFVAETITAKLWPQQEIKFTDGPETT